MANKCSEACSCRNLICGIVFLTVGTVCVVGGGVIAAVGFGTRPKDMFDDRILSMRVAGLCLAGIGILPIIMGIMFTVFYCSFKQGKMPGQKKPLQKDVELSVITKHDVGRNEYPYPVDGDPLILKPRSTADDSLVKYDDYEKDGHYSFASNQSGRISTDERGNNPVYSELKAPPSGGTSRTTTTSATTTVTKTYKTETLDSNPGSGSSGITFRSGTLPEKKAKRQKKQQLPGNEIAAGPMLSEVHSFDETDVLTHQKAKHLKKPKRNGPLPSEGDEVFDDMEEPLPDGRYHSHGSDRSNTQQAKPSFEHESDSPSDGVYGKVKKSRNKKV